MAVFLGLAAAPALAQSAEEAPPADAYESPAFQAFLTSDYANRLRRETLQRSMVLNQPECMEEPTFHVTDSWPVLPIVMYEGDITPTAGVWRERVESTACDETVTENMVHTFTADGERTFLLVRGTTETDLETQFALINDARDAAAADDNAAGCDIIRFTDTSVANRYNDGRWRERWVADACGEEVDLDIVFTPNEGGAATYTISAAR